MSDRSSEDGGATVSPPPAPPLPPQPSSARAAANAIARFAQNINYGTRASTAAHGLQRSPAAGLSLQRSSRSEHEIPSLNEDLLKISPFGPRWKSPMVPSGVDSTPADRICSPVSSRTTSHRTGIPIASFDISPCRTRAILAGRDILKTLAVTGSTCNEDYNLREKVIRYAATHEPAAGRVAAKHKDLLAINDVKWSHGDFHTTIATAAANGQIVVYDLNRAGVELARLHEHTRQVHRLGFNPHRGNLLLSGSQDATMKLWDLRALAGERNVMTCHSKSRYAGNSEGVRDLRWSPTNGVEFAIGTDSGAIQRWDIRKESSPTLKVNAHEKTCNAVDWHPDGKHLVSGSADKTAKVWDFSSSDRRMKPLWQIRCPQAALNVRWRPVGWSTEDHHPGGWHCTQLAVSYDNLDPRIHIWELRRPSVPFRILDRYDTPPSAILWHSEDLLWSVGSAGMFTQTDVRFAPKPMDGYNVNPIATAPDGQILFASLKRERRRSSIEDVTDNLLSIERREAGKSGGNSTGHSGTPGSHEEPTLLSSTFRNRRNKAPNSLKSARSMDTTPPSIGPDDAVLPLEQSLHERNMFKNPQVIAMGYVPGIMDAEAFKFMARHYLPPPEVHAGNRSFDLHLVLNKTFRHNARVAAFVGKYRLAQTWKILGLAVEEELGRRAEQNYQLRTAAATKEESQEAPSNQLVESDPYNPFGVQKHADSESTVTAPRTATSAILQTLSNNSTPPARPSQGPRTGLEPIENIETTDEDPSMRSRSPTKGHRAARAVARVPATPVASNPDQTESMKENRPFQLTSVKAPSEDDATFLSEPRSPNHKPLADTGFDELDRQIAERRAAMGSYRAQPRPVLKLDDPFRGVGSGSNIPKLSSEDSNEVFQIFSASTDSSHKSRSIMGSFEGNRASGRLGNTTEVDIEHERIEKSSERGQAESAMEFDDEAEMVAAQHSPASPKSSMSPGKGKGKALTISPARSMPSVECSEHEPPIINFEDMHPLKNVVLPPEHEPVKGGYKYIEADFFATIPKEDDLTPPFPPWTATAMFLPLITFHCESLFDSQLPAYLLLHLAPWLYVPMSPFRARQIITTYHDRLISLQLYAQAAELRIYCEDNYPEVTAYRGEGIDTGGPWCTNCKKISKGRQPNYCERCRRKWADCTICHGYSAIAPDRPTDLETVKLPRATNANAADASWGWCPRCGHGGHVGCLRTFWNFSEEGACPFEGCTCDCMPGKTRERIHKRLAEDWKKKSGTVTKDSWNVKESGAVQRTRSMVGAAEAGRSILQGGRGAGRGDVQGGPQTLGIAGRSASGGKKSVRIVVPDEEKVEAGKENGKDSKSSSSAP